MSNADSADKMGSNERIANSPSVLSFLSSSCRVLVVENEKCAKNEGNHVINFPRF